MVSEATQVMILPFSSLIPKLYLTAPVTTDEVTFEPVEPVVRVTSVGVATAEFVTTYLTISYLPAESKLVR